MKNALQKTKESAEYIRDYSRSTSPELISKYAEDIICLLEELKKDVDAFNDLKAKSMDLVHEVHKYCEEWQDRDVDGRFEGMMTKANAIYRYLLKRDGVELHTTEQQENS